jgi:tetratricopeptide (TPR) repeat protein
MLGLLLILVDLVSRAKLDRNALSAAGLAVVLAAAFGTHARAAVWSDEVAIWEDTARKSPGAWRPHFQLAFAYQKAERYQSAIEQYELANRLHPGDADLLLDWGLAYDDLGQFPQALEKLHASAALKPSAHVYSQIGEVYGKLQDWPNALAALTQAQTLDPSFVDTYIYLGVMHTQTTHLLAAIQDFQQALRLDPDNVRAHQFLKSVVAELQAKSAAK